MANKIGNKLTQAAEIKTAIKEGKAILGGESVVNALQRNVAGKIFLAGNAPSAIKERITYYAKTNNVDIEVFDGNSYDLGIICKKPFVVSALAVKK